MTGWESAYMIGGAFVTFLALLPWALRQLREAVEILASTVPSTKKVMDSLVQVPEED